MKHTKNIIFVLLFIGIILPFSVFAVLELNLDYPTFGGIDIDCKDPSAKCGQDLPSLVAWFYYFIIGISGFAAFIMIVWGGVQWMTSAGNPTATTEAKDRIQQALLGLLLILASFLILQVINPELLQL